jgi:hypothetical protein
VLDRTGSLKAMKKLLGHADCRHLHRLDIDQLAETMRQVLASEDDDQSFPPD